MADKRNIWGRIIGISVIALIVIACGFSSDIVATPTPTIASGGGPILVPSLTVNGCEGLSGTFEMQILVGPAEAVGLEPVAVGEIPFSVVAEDRSYNVQGSGVILYEDVLEMEWGTYAVSMDMGVIASGTCSGEAGSEALQVMIQTSGEQMVEVRAKGFEGDYPWSGTQTLYLYFPLEEGAMAEGEGWSFVLHLGQ